VGIAEKIFEVRGQGHDLYLAECYNDGGMHFGGVRSKLARFASPVRAEDIFALAL